ncbi:MAG: hypothetical protein RL199_1370 [Pseudomonadota bacterium]|jgi:epoxyqueuosine reductase
MSPDPTEAAAAVKAAAKAHGFDLVGIAPAAPLDPGPLDRWLANGWDADLWYVRQSRDERLDVSRVLPGARSVVAVAVNYRHEDEPAPEEGHGVVARYARGRDYHNVLRRPLRRLRDAIEEIVPGSTGYASCDARPVMEKAWANLAGLGWVGKNGCFIAPPYGSWVLLGCVVTTAELAADRPHPDRCGTCTACLMSCPTDAIPQPRFVDARKCLSFHTIEHQQPLPPGIAEKLSGRLFGCDLCQEPCPWNREAEPAAGRLGQALAPRPGQSFVPLESLLRSSREEVEARVAGTALARAGADGLVRTARALSGEPS